MRGLMAIGAITVAIVLFSLFLTNERAHGHHQEDSGPHCRYGINVYSPSTNQNLRIAEFGVHSRMNPGYSTENPRDFLEAYARIDKFADTCVFKENFARGWPSGAPEVVGDQRGLGDCHLDLDRSYSSGQRGARTNSMFIDYPRFFAPKVDVGYPDVRSHVADFNINNRGEKIHWFYSNERSGARKPSDTILESVKEFCRGLGDDVNLELIQVALRDWFRRHTTCADIQQLGVGGHRSGSRTCGQIRQLVQHSDRASSIRNVPPNRQLPSNAPDFGISLEQNVDRPGMDYGRISLNSNDGPDACQWLCQNDNKCRAFTFVRRGFQGSRPICYMKSGVPNKVSPRPCCVSGKKTITLNNQDHSSGSSTAQPRKKAEDRAPKNFNNLPNITSRKPSNPSQNQRMTFEQNSDRPGSDYSKITMSSNARPSMCSNMCEKDRRCKAFTFVRKGFQGNTAVCYLKDRSPKLIKNKNCCVSGVKR